MVRWRGRRKGQRLSSRYATKGGRKRLKRDARRVYDFNKRHKVVGPTPDYLVSPFEMVPVAGQYAEAQRAYQGASWAYDRAYDYQRRKKKSRGGRSKSSSITRRRPRGKYYYYRGKRYYRK